MTEKILKVKAHMDYLQDDWETVLDFILDSIQYRHDDDVFEFEIVVRNVKDLTEVVGVDVDGCRAFRGVEFEKPKEPEG